MNHWHLFDAQDRTVLRFANEEDVQGYIRMHSFSESDVHVGSCSLSHQECITKHQLHTTKGKGAVRLINNDRD
jgi:hypothetical protein